MSRNFWVLSIKSPSFSVQWVSLGFSECGIYDNRKSCRISPKCDEVLRCDHKALMGFRERCWKSWGFINKYIHIFLKYSKNMGNILEVLFHFPRSFHNGSPKTYNISSKYGDRVLTTNNFSPKLRQLPSVIDSILIYCDMTKVMPRRLVSETMNVSFVSEDTASTRWPGMQYLLALVNYSRYSWLIGLVRKLTGFLGNFRRHSFAITHIPTSSHQMVNL